MTSRVGYSYPRRRVIILGRGLSPQDIRMPTTKIRLQKAANTAQRLLRNARAHTHTHTHTQHAEGLLLPFGPVDVLRRVRVRDDAKAVLGF